MGKNEFDCTNCGFCCGPVPITKREFNRIKRYVKKMSLAEIYRLKGQKKSPIDCIFRDKENDRCSIYPVRPDICKMFGYYEGMECPNNLSFATRSKESGYKRIEKNAQKSEILGVMSVDITLKSFLK